MRILLLLLFPLYAWGQTPEATRSWYTVIMEMLAQPGLGAVMVGMAVAFVVPQRVKMDFPQTWTTEKRARMTRMTSFLSGFITTIIMWPVFWGWKDADFMDRYGIWAGGFIAALLVGAAAPMTYKVVMNQLYKRNILKEENWSGEFNAQRKLDEQ